MPFYTFKCPECNLELEEMRKMGDFKEPLCQKCSTVIPKREIHMKKQMGSPSFKFNGSGFYETDYKKPKLTMNGIPMSDTPEEAQERAEEAASKRMDDSE